MEDPAPVEVAPEAVATEESASSAEDKTPVETPTDDDSEGMTAIKAIEDPVPEDVAAIVDLRRSPSSEDQTPVEIVMTSETAIPEGMAATEPIEEPISAEVASSDEVTSGTTTDDGTTAMEDASTIKDPMPVEVAVEETAKEESAASDEIPSDDQTPEEIASSNETTTGDDPDGITAIEVIEDIFESAQENEAIPAEADAPVP